MAFLSTPGTEKLYSGVEMMSPSAAGDLGTEPHDGLGETVGLLHIEVVEGDITDLGDVERDAVGKHPLHESQERAVEAGGSQAAADTNQGDGRVCRVHRSRKLTGIHGFYSRKRRLRCVMVDFFGR